jgi:hypothetical protein
MLNRGQERQLDRLLCDEHGLRLGIAGRDRLQQSVGIRLQPRDLGRHR